MPYKTKYVVVGSKAGATKRMFTSYDYDKARQFFNAHPTAHGIQKYHGDLTAGLIQPSIPNKIRYRGKIYERGYVGGHSKLYAGKLVKSFTKEGHPAIARKGKHGYQVFVHF